MDGTSHTGPADWLRLVHTISLCGRLLRKALADVAAPRGLTDTEGLILWACGQAPAEGQAQHELAALVGVSPAQLSGLVERLGERGWIVPWRPAHDRRRQFWRLTPTGQALLGEILLALNSWLQASVRFASGEDRAFLLERLSQLASALEDRGAPLREAA